MRVLRIPAHNIEMCNLNGIVIVHLAGMPVSTKPQIREFIILLIVIYYGCFWHELTANPYAVRIPLNSQA
jgi:hypothetical protein